MVWRTLGRIGLTGTSLVLVAAVWVATHLRDLPEVNDAGLRTIHRVAPDADAGPALYRAESLLHLEKDQESHLWEWAKGKSWDEAGVAALLAKNAPALEALTAADGKPGLAIPPERVHRYAPGDLGRSSDRVFEDFMAWQNLAKLRVLRGLQLSRSGKTQAALGEILATVRLGYVIESAANGSIIHYMAGDTIKSAGLARLIDSPRMTTSPVKHSSNLLRRSQRSASTSEDSLTLGLESIAGPWMSRRRSVPRFTSLPRSARTFWLPVVDGRFAAVFGTLLPVDYLYQPHRSEALWADFYRSLQRSAGLTYRESSHELPDPNSTESLLRLLAEPNPFGVAMWHLIAPGLKHLSARKCAENVRSRATIAILALLAYEHEHGALPERLEDLVPSELGQVPIDDFDGAPLRYSRERRRLWSVGADLRDEGGSDKGVTPDLKQPTFIIPG